MNEELIKVCNKRIKELKDELKEEYRRDADSFIIRRLEGKLDGIEWVITMAERLEKRK